MQGHVGLTSDDIPDACWEQPGFQDEYNSRMAYLDASIDAQVQEAMDSGACDDYYPCYSELYWAAESEIVGQMMKEYGCASVGPGVPGYGDPCTSTASIMAAQIALRHWVPNLAVDGAWGKNSQAALDASGVSFQDLVQGCTPPVPYYTATGGGAGTGTGTTTPPGPGGGGGGGGGGLTNINVGESSSQSSKLAVLAVGFAVVLGVGAAVAYTRKGKR